MEIRSSRDERRDTLQADCAGCFGLCCVALAFARSADFARDKGAGEPCENLDAGFRCTIHSKLRPSGYKGCTVFDCFGAGQKVSQETFGGVSWRDDPETRARMFAVFPAMRQLHEFLWYLAEAGEREEALSLHVEIERMRVAVESLTSGDPASILAVDVEGQRAILSPLLARVSERVRAAARSDKALSETVTPAAKLVKRLRPGGDLVGAALGGLDLRGASLRGAYLIAADLRGADLRSADLLGADLRDAELGGADLSNALFVTQFQVNAARGDGETRLPSALVRPSHWG